MRILSFAEEQQLSYCDKIKYYKELREYLCLTSPKYNDMQIGKRRKLNESIIQSALERYQKYNIRTDGLENIPDGPVIYACNHQSFNDIINIIGATKKHAVILNNKHVNILLKIALEINGVVFIVRDDEKSNFDAKNEMMRLLLNGISLFVFPEATWNMTPSKPLLPMKWGIIDMAMKTRVPIIPVVQEYMYDENIVDGKEHITEVRIKYGSPIYVSHEDSHAEKLEEYKESMSTLLWSLWSEKGLFYRENINNRHYVSICNAKVRKIESTGNKYEDEENCIFLPNYQKNEDYPINMVEYENDGVYILKK